MPFSPRRWISGKVIEILGNEDDVVIDFVYSLLEEERIVCCPFFRSLLLDLLSSQRWLMCGVGGASLTRRKYKSVSRDSWRRILLRSVSSSGGFC